MNKVFIKFKNGIRKKFRYVYYIAYIPEDNEIHFMRWIYKNNCQRRLQEEKFELSEIEYMSISQMQSYHQW